MEFKNKISAHQFDWSDKEEEKMEPCDLCDGTDLRHLFSNHDRMYRNRDARFELVRCRTCGLIRLASIPSQDEIGGFYPKTYYSLSGSTINIRIPLLLARFHQGRGILDKIAAFVSFPLYRIRLNRTLPHLKKPMRLLDIGCGNGAFLLLAKKLGFEAYGVEPSEFDPTISWKEEICIHRGFLSEAHYDKGTFDVITLNHVIEHVPSPSAMFAEVSDLAKDGGYIIVATPNTRSPGFWLFGKYWMPTDTPRHIHLLSVQNLLDYGENAGLRIEKVNYNAVPEFYLDSIRFILEEKLGKPIKYPFHIQKLLVVLLYPYSELMNSLRLGDAVEVVFRKD